MSDGWQAYRHLPQRLRYWAHLTRKAQDGSTGCGTIKLGLSYLPLPYGLSPPAKPDSSYGKACAHPRLLLMPMSLLLPPR